MKTVLQQSGSGCYLTENGSWSQDISEARNFSSTITARTHAIERDLSGVQIVLKFDVKEYDIILPIYYP